MAMLVITRWQLSNPHKWDEAFLWGLTKNDKHIKQHQLYSVTISGSKDSQGIMKAPRF